MAEWWEIEPSSCDAAVLRASTLPVRAAGDIVNRLKPGANVIVLGKLDNEGTVLHAKATAVLEDAGLEIRDCGAIITADGLLSVLFARKPPEGTVAANTLKHGVGGLNIDGSRIGFDDTRSVASLSALGQNSGWNDHANREVMAGSACGRWPANLLLEHTPECRKTGAVAEVTGGGTAGTSGFAAGYEAGDGYDGRVVTSESWVCGDSCPVKELDEQSGERPGGAYPAQRGEPVATAFGKGTPPTTGGARAMGDKGGASRFFHQDAAALSPLPFDAAPEQAPLLAYLLRLITPEGGAILGSFDDSVTRKTAESKGFRFIGVTRRNDG
jgi:site-specific DNA-methyltransferase (adenine-specific)